MKHSNNHWSLVLFTFFVQLAVGTFWALAVAAPRQPLLITGLTAVLACLLIGVLAAGTHLNRPTRGVLALANLESSWLSREALAGALFSLGVLGLMASQYLNAEHYLTNPLGALVSAMGVVLIYVICRLYMLRTVPAWDSLATPVSFFMSALIGGMALCGAILILGGDTDNRSIFWISTLLPLVAPAQVVLMWLHHQRLGRGEGAALESAQILSSRRPLLAARTVTTLVGASSFFYLFNLSCNPSALWPAIPGVAFILAGELIGRYLFFAMFRRDGLNL